MGVTTMRAITMGVTTMGGHNHGDHNYEGHNHTDHTHGGHNHTDIRTMHNQGGHNNGGHPPFLGGSGSGYNIFGGSSLLTLFKDSNKENCLNAPAKKNPAP